MRFDKLSTNGWNVVLAMPAPFTLSLPKGGAGIASIPLGALL